MFKNNFGENIFRNKYALTPEQTWEEKAHDIVKDVTTNLMSKEDQDELKQYITNFKFLPGGRYIYYAGRQASFYNNCYLLKGEEDTREEWGNLLKRASDCLMAGGGIGIDYSVFRPKGAHLGRTGGEASGPLPLMDSINAVGRNVMQGGSRRSAIYASLNWQHKDAPAFLKMKDWHSVKINDDFTVFDAKQYNFNYPAPLDQTNVSLNYDNKFLDRISQGQLPPTFIENCRQAMMTGEPGFSFNFGDKENETLRNACVAYDTPILTDEGYVAIGDFVGHTFNIWNGESFEPVVFRETGEAPLYRVTLSDGSYLDCTSNHKWCIDGEFVETEDLLIGSKLDKFPMPKVRFSTEIDDDSAKYYYSQGFYAGDGNKGRDFSWVYHTKYCCIPNLLGDVLPDIEGRMRWNHRQYDFDKDYVPFHEGYQERLAWLAGILDSDGTVTRDTNGNGFQIASVNHQFLENVRLMLTTLGVRAKVVSGVSEGMRPMPDGKGGYKDYLCKETKRLLIGNTDAYSLMQDGLGKYLLRCAHNNQAPQRDARQFVKVVNIEDLGITEMTYCFTEPKTNRGTFNGIVTGQCTEVTSEDDSDVCNLGSVNMGAISTLDEFRAVIRLASGFLVCGTITADLPYDKVYAVRKKNRRLGLGLMGIHEWLLKRGHQYGMVPELRQWLEVYREESERAANSLCDRLSISRPVAYRAIAPTGTIGILAGTTTGIEPLYAVAYKRRYLVGGTKWKYEYVVDGTAEALVREGVDPDKIETSTDLVNDFERRLAFQADVQDYVDMAISSTINLPKWGTEHNNEDKVMDFAKILAKYAPRLRGFTVYPDGARGGQPLNQCSYKEAMKHKDVVFEENSEAACGGGVCGL